MHDLAVVLTGVDQAGSGIAVDLEAIGGDAANFGLGIAVNFGYSGIPDLGCNGDDYTEHLALAVV
jgi:hypothetical protein